MVTHGLQWPGVPLALASAVLFGASAPFAKLLLGSSDPQLLAGLLYLGAGIGLAIWRAGRAALGLGAAEAPLRRTDARWLIAIVVFGGVIGPLFLMLGLVRTSAASGSLLLNLEGLATMAIAWVVFRENVDRKLLLGAASILAGAAVLSWQEQGMRIEAGGLLIAVACLAWGIDNNLTRKLSSADPVAIALIKGVAAGATNLLLALFLGARPSVWFCSCWRSAISAAPGREPISRWRRSSARSSRSSCSASRCRHNWSWPACLWRSAYGFI